MNNLKEAIEERLRLKDPGLIGCRRRNAWQGDREVWRKVRGNSLLDIVGQKASITTSVGELEFYHKSGDILFFRGGKWSSYWLDDFRDVWALARAFWSRPVGDNVIVLQEDKGILEVHTVPIGQGLDAEPLAHAIIEEHQADPPGRICKSTARALVTCRWCPVRTRCNAQDLIDGNMDDWSPTYQKSLR